MKVGTFIKIIADSFANQIQPSDSTGRVKNALRYSTVLTWFVDESADENELITRVMQKSDAACDKYLNPNSDKDMPINDAKLLKGTILPFGFETIFNEANLTDDDLDYLRKELSKDGIIIKGINYPEEITSAFLSILEERANKNKKNSIRGATFIGNNQVKIGTKIINLPNQLSVPNLPTKHENKYITALLEVYTVDSKREIKSLSDLDSFPIYKTDLQMHREDFYSAESVLHQIRDFFYDGEKEFNDMKNEIYQAIKRKINLPTDNPFEKVNTVMDFVITVTFSKSYLSQTGNGLIGPSEKHGMVHMLVNEGSVKWIILYSKEA